MFVVLGLAFLANLLPGSNPPADGGARTVKFLLKYK
jgi:hypothetical protein